MPRRPVCPCRGCQDRWRDGSKTCHQECDRYSEWKNILHTFLEDVKYEQQMEYATKKIIYSKRKKK